MYRGKTVGLHKVIARATARRGRQGEQKEDGVSGSSHNNGNNRNPQLQLLFAVENRSAAADGRTFFERV